MSRSDLFGYGDSKVQEALRWCMSLGNGRGGYDCGGCAGGGCEAYDREDYDREDYDREDHDRDVYDAKMLRPHPPRPNQLNLRCLQRLLPDHRADCTATAQLRQKSPALY